MSTQPFITEEDLENLKAASTSLKEISESLSDVKFVTNQLGKKGIVKTFETTMEINSPSRVMKRLGQYVVAGLGEGIEDKLRDIKKSMSKLTDAVLHHRISSQGFI